MKVTLPTKTNVSTVGGSLSIYTFYQKCLNFMAAWINGAPRNIEGVDFKEGELGYKILGWDDVFSLNSRGELIVTGSNPNKYSINQGGMLISNVDFCDNYTPPTDFPYWYGDLAAYFIIDSGMSFGPPSGDIFFTDQITGSKAMINGANITFPEIGISNVFNFSDPTYWNVTGLPWYNPADPYTCPLEFLQGLTWQPYATDALNMRMYHKDFLVDYKSVIPILVYKRDLTIAEQHQIVEYMNTWYIVTYGGAILEDRLYEVIIHDPTT